MISLTFIGLGLGLGLAVLGVSLGIGRIGGQAVESMGRQPEAAGKIQTAMLIAAALIEGVGLFALVIVLMMLLGVGGLSEAISKSVTVSTQNTEVPAQH